MNGKNYEELQINLKLDKVYFAKKLRIGFNVCWSDFSDKVLGVPSHIILEMGKF
jgi:hypothetical protein